jgi:UTP--glucose-1-phosphate uridylyltransferase
MNSQKIRKVVIPAAGYGTRFLPQTKAMPKEMLPIVDKPVIQYVVEEAVASDVKDIVIVTGAAKRAIEDHFDRPSASLINNLKQGNKHDYIEKVKQIAEMANFIYIRQKGSYGNGTPVLSAEPIVGGESFAVMWAQSFLHFWFSFLVLVLGTEEQSGGSIFVSSHFNQLSFSNFVS